MTDHETDAAGNRDLTKEGDELKQKLTMNKEPPITIETKYSIKFPSLAQSTIPNLSASKIIFNRLTVRYVPDFYYIMERCQHLFSLAKNDKSLKKTEGVDIYSFTLYMAYSLMYVYLENIQENGNTDPNVDDVLQLMRSAGYSNLKFPSIATTWIDSLGKYLDPETKRIFVPYLPNQVTQGDYYDNYFFSEDTGHLLPNFRGIITMICLFCDRMQINLPPNNRNRNVKLGGDFPAIAQLVGSTETRRNLYRIPGMRRLATTLKDDILAPTIVNLLNRANWPSDLHRYMMLDIETLRLLKEMVSPLFNEIETYVYSNVAPTGNAFVTVPLISDPTRQEIIAPVNIAPINAAGNAAAIPTVIINSGFDFASRVKSRTEIVNGFVDYAYQTPIVRIIENVESVSINNHVHVNPQDNWYTIEHEFQTPVLTLPETSAYFSRI